MQTEKRVTTSEVVYTTLIVLSVVGIITLAFWGCPRYNVYRSTLEGKAELQRAEYNRNVKVLESKAKMEASRYEYMADTIRAHGIARANEIIGTSLRNNEAYLNWLWIDQIKDTKNQIIYVPGGNMGMPILEAGRGVK